MWIKRKRDIGFSCPRKTNSNGSRIFQITPKHHIATNLWLEGRTLTHSLSLSLSLSLRARVYVRARAQLYVTVCAHARLCVCQGWRLVGGYLSPSSSSSFPTCESQEVCCRCLLSLMCHALRCQATLHFYITYFLLTFSLPFYRQHTVGPLHLSECACARACA